MNKRDLRLDDYGISGKRYKELCGFCEQYPEWKQQINGNVAVPSVRYDGSTHKVDNISDPTGNTAIAITRKRANCLLIERVAQEAAGDLSEYIIKAVCYEAPVTYLLYHENMPCSKSSFYDIRRYFFFLLDKEKNKNSEF